LTRHISRPFSPHTRTQPDNGGAAPIVELREILSLVGRTVLFYLLALAVVRLMGKREVGQLSPMDLVVAVMIAEASVIAIEEPSIPILAGIVPVVVLFLAELLVSFVSLRFEGFRRIVADKPSVVIRHGTLDLKEMRRQRYNLDDLMEQLRLEGYASPADVEFAVLETSGDLSVIPKAEKRPVTPQDLGLKPPREGLPAVVIADGHVENESLQRIHKTSDWLTHQLARRGYESPEDIFLGVYLPDGQLFLRAQENGKAGESTSRSE